MKILHLRHIKAVAGKFIDNAIAVYKYDFHDSYKAALIAPVTSRT